MKKYNYFDDDPDDYRVKTKHEKTFRVGALTNGAKQSFEDFVHGNTFSDFKEIYKLPNLRAVLLKMLAVILFIIFVIVFILGFSHTISSQNKKNEKFYTDAGSVCTDYVTEYGVPKSEAMDSDTYGDDMYRLTGLCYARQMDFNNDGDDELMLCYNNRNVYTLEVWGYDNKDFVKLYSEEANKTDDATDGSWIAFYFKNNKYYICKTSTDEPNTVTMYALKGTKFKESFTCDYDVKNNIYSIKGKINATDFETIKLNMLKSSKAESTVDTVTANIDTFNTVSLATINTQKTADELKADAYYKIIEDRNEKYGKAKVAESEGVKYIDGLAVVDLVDFDGDDNEELLLVYRKMVKENATNAYSGERIIIENPTYCIEVYSWNGTVASKVFSNDNVSNYMNKSTVNYVMLKNNSNSVDICTNTYSYTNENNYTASTKIFSYKDGSFESTFSAREEDSYGYKSYYLDGTYSYRSDFESQAYQVPKFLNDDESYDDSKYTLIYLSGINSDEYDSTINHTVKTIGDLNKSYSADD